MACGMYRVNASQISSLALLISLALIGSVSFGRGQSVSDSSARHARQSSTRSPVQSPVQSSASHPPNDPTGAGRCVFCHPAEVEGYAQSSMSHSLRRAGQEPEGTVNAHATKITMHSSPSGYWQRWENGSDTIDYRVDYVVGSGTHASGYLIDIGGHLFQSPVAYYSSRQAYDLAPGYENQPDPDFTRPISEECVLCHSGTALHIPGTLNQYRAPVFSAEGISCERCHGPVESHLANSRAGTIVNPAKLASAARDSVCEQCHLFGAARVPNPGKKLSDFVPGQPLENTYTVYHNVVPAGASAGDFKVISHVEQLALSACARNSDGKLWCGTCHNPHAKPVDALQYYRARCLSCHTSSFPASHPSKESDCLQCHMPKRDAKDGGHAAFTDHRIQRRPEVMAESSANTAIAPWREPAPDLQKRNLGIAYIDIGMQRHSSPCVIQGYRMLTEVQQQFRDDSDFFKWIGEALLLGKRTSDAKFAFERALQLDPDSALTEASAAAPFLQEGDAPGAIAHLERAVALDPLNLPTASTLIGLYRSQGKPAEAAALSEKIKVAMSEGSSSAQTMEQNSPADSQKRVEEVFKNIQVLKGIPSGQLLPAMQFMSSALGVECSFCHVEGHFERDDKKTKKNARDMMQMMFALNKVDFNGKREVTCYSCHRGTQKPVATPVIGKEVPPDPGASDSETYKLPANLPTVAQLIDNYIHALGGPAAIGNVTSRVQKGTAIIGGQSVRVEDFTEAPGRHALVRHLAGGDNVEIFDGRVGWIGVTGRSSHEIHGAELEAIRIEADLQFPLHIQTTLPELRVEYPEKIDGREVNVLYGVGKNGRVVKFYFDEQSSLLVRLTFYVDSPLGRNPLQFDFADYRDVDGVQIPFRITCSRPGSSWTSQLDEVRQNIPIDAAKFANPLANHSPKNSAPPD
jgi:photosynthetic reaction center cytochrome c subunit